MPPNPSWMPPPADRYERVLMSVLWILLFGAPDRPPLGRFADTYAAMTIFRIALLALLGYAIFHIVVVIRKLKANSSRR